MKRIVCSLLMFLLVLSGTGLSASGSANSGSSAMVPADDLHPPASSIPRTLFGLNMNNFVTNGKMPWPRIPYGSHRLWDSATGWAQLNPRKGEYDWSQLDKWLAAIGKGDNKTEDILFTFGRVPAFASSRPNDQSCGYGPGQCAPPSDVNADGGGSDQYWKDFVTALVTHSKNSRTAHIKYWEIWNEPYGPKMWTGTNRQLVRLGRDARSIIKSIDPDAMLVGPCLGINVPRGHKWLQWFDDYLAEGGGDNADILAVHGYVHRDGQQPGAQALVDYYKQFREIVAKHGLTSKPVWDTEGSWGPTKNFPDEDQQQAFVVQFYLLHWSMGIERVYWYAYNGYDVGVAAFWADRRGDPSSGHLDKAGEAFVTAQDWLVGATMTEPCKRDGSVWSCNLIKDGHPAQIVWNSGGEKPYAPKGTFKKLHDLDGNANMVSGPVRIGAKPILLEAQ
jgi:hypothetical protein